MGRCGAHQICLLSGKGGLSATEIGPTSVLCCIRRNLVGALGLPRPNGGAHESRSHSRQKPVGSPCQGGHTRASSPQRPTSLPNWQQPKHAPQCLPMRSCSRTANGSKGIPAPVTNRVNNAEGIRDVWRCQRAMVASGPSHGLTADAPLEMVPSARRAAPRVVTPKALPAAFSSVVTTLDDDCRRANSNNGEKARGS